MAEDRDWRLKAELDTADRRGVLDHVLGRLRGPSVLEEIGAAVSDDVVITHDGELLFAYAASGATLEAARGVIEGILREAGVNTSIVVSHWDDDLAGWHQTDPPLGGEAKRVDDAAMRDAEAPETRTMVATSGKEVRVEFERSMASWAEELGLGFDVIEHPHLLTTQVAFTVTGPKGKIDQFARGLKAEERATIRSERAVMTSPL
jgi:hypothetical protein